MPVAKSKIRPKSRVKTVAIQENVQSSRISPSALSELIKFRPSKLIIIAAIIIILAIIISSKKEWFIAGTVNGSPITNWEVLSRLNATYRKQTVDQLVNEKLILGEASKKGIRITEADINNKIKEIETQLGGASALDNLLAQQGQTRNSIRDEIRLQLSVDKMFSGESSVSAEEVTKFIEQNKDQMQSSTEAELTKEATEILKQQKVTQAFSTAFQKIKQDAKIQIF
jgi:parvulin-like peptidyl-prolyl isomerase